MRLATQHPFQFLSHRDTTSHDHHVDIVRRALEEDVTDIATHHVTLQT
jgi:hypothetical protein